MHLLSFIYTQSLIIYGIIINQCCQLIYLGDKIYDLMG